MIHPTGSAARWANPSARSFARDFLLAALDDAGPQRRLRVYLNHRAVEPATTRGHRASGQRIFVPTVGVGRR